MIYEKMAAHFFAYIEVGISFLALDARFAFGTLRVKRHGMLDFLYGIIMHNITICNIKWNIAYQLAVRSKRTLVARLADRRLHHKIFVRWMFGYSITQAIDSVEMNEGRQ